MTIVWKIIVLIFAFILGWGLGEWVLNVPSQIRRIANSLEQIKDALCKEPEIVVEKHIYEFQEDLSDGALD